MNLDRDAARLLAEIGFLGIGRGEGADAADIFATLRLLRPQDDAGPIGLALAALGAGACDQAQDILARAPQTEAVVAFAVMAHAMGGDRAQAELLCEDLRAMHPDAGLVAMAEAALAGPGADQELEGQVG